jgi:hypothetical protein
VRAAAAVVVLALAGCGSGAGRPHSPTPASPAARASPAPPTDEQQVEDALRRYAAALGSAPRIRALRVRDVVLDPDRIVVTGRRAHTRALQQYAVGGVRSTYQSVRRVDLVKRRGRWRVVRLGGRRGLPPWEVARFTERRTPHFVVLASEGVPVDELLGSLEDGYAEMRARLETGRLRRRYLVIVAADAAQARALTTRIRGLETLAAIADASIVEQGAAQAVSHVLSVRLLVVYDAFASQDVEGRRRTIAHELTHAALAGFTSGRTPAWLAEGVAMYASGDRRPAPPRADLGRLSEPSAIARLSGSAQADAYGASSAAAFAIVERFGSRRLLKLYDSFNDDTLRGVPGRGLANRAVRRELGIRLNDLM